MVQILRPAPLLDLHGGHIRCQSVTRVSDRLSLRFIGRAMIAVGFAIAHSRQIVCAPNVSKAAPGHHPACPQVLHFNVLPLEGCLAACFDVRGTWVESVASGVVEFKLKALEGQKTSSSRALLVAYSSNWHLRKTKTKVHKNRSYASTGARGNHATL